MIRQTLSIQDHVIDDHGIEGHMNTNDETLDIPTPASNDARLNESAETISADEGDSVALIPNHTYTDAPTAERNPMIEASPVNEEFVPRRSTRSRKLPDYYGYNSSC